MLCGGDFLTLKRTFIQFLMPNLSLIYFLSEIFKTTFETSNPRLIKIVLELDPCIPPISFYYEILRIRGPG